MTPCPALAASCNRKLHNAMRHTATAASLALTHGPWDGGDVCAAYHVASQGRCSAHMLQVVLHGGQHQLIVCLQGPNAVLIV